MSENPVFYDATGRRRRRFLVAAVAFALLLVLAVAAFAATVLDVVPQSALPFHAERAQLRKPTGAERLVAQGRQTLRHTVHAGKRLFRTGPAVSPPLAVAFHAPWDDASAASLQRNISQLDWLVPGWLSITGPQHQVTLFPDARGRAIIAGAARRPKVLPMVQNALNGEWDGAGAAALMRDPTATFLVRVSGDSMTGAGIFDGDELVVDRGLDAHDGNVVVAVVNAELTVKRLSYRQGQMVLSPENPAYPEIVLSELDEATIWGVVTRCLHRV